MYPDHSGRDCDTCSDICHMISSLELCMSLAKTWISVNLMFLRMGFESLWKIILYLPTLRISANETAFLGMFFLLGAAGVIAPS